MYTLTPPEMVYCVVVLLLAYGLRGSTGFGGALGMPFLALVIPLKVLVPVWTLLGAASSITILGRDRRRVVVRDLLAFIPWCVLGIIVGLYFFKTLDARTLAHGLGILLMIYGSHALWRTLRPARPRRVPPRIVGPLASAVSGVVGALFGTMATAFFAVYLDARGLAKEAFRATISAMLLTLSVVRGIGYYVVGEFTLEVWLTFAAALPLMLAGIYVGDRIHVNMSETTFRRLISVLLVLCGVPLLMK
ncbi:MAG: sulfite exporter TauE/SafE family protein [Burkholderiales bacterium]|nr:sulfite exporter TauE/SafE family protein [Burkholderiales bacterium]